MGETSAVCLAWCRIGSRLSAVCLCQWMRDSVECRTLTSVIISVSLCEPVAGETERVLHCQHVIQTKTPKRPLIYNSTFTTATVSQIYSRQNTGMAWRSLSVHKINKMQAPLKAAVKPLVKKCTSQTKAQTARATRQEEVGR